MLWIFGVLVNVLAIPSSKPQSKLPARSSFKGYLSPKESFQFNFQCDHENKTACTLAANAVKQVGILMANELLFKRPANVKVSFLNVTATDYIDMENYKTTPPVSNLY